MKPKMKAVLFGVTLLLLNPVLRGQEAARWVFEGVITECDSAFAPDLQSGWVLSGSFLFEPIEMEVESVESKPGGGRLSGGISAAEMTIDLYYQLHFEAEQVPGLIGFDYQDNDPEEEGRDLLGWYFPMQGRLKETDWSSKWLQIWLADEEGKMLRTVPPRISPYGLEWKRAWFRITFENESGKTAYADGRMELFLPESKLGEADAETEWKTIAANLSSQLMDRDSTISSLRGELEEVSGRLAGLRRMVDLLVEERANLREDNARLQDQVKLVDPEMEATLAELTVEKSLLENEITDLSDQNDALTGSLAASEKERLLLAAQLQEMLDREEAAKTREAEVVTMAVLRNEAVPSAERPVVRPPAAVEQSFEEKRPTAAKEAPVEAEAKSGKAREKKVFSSRRFGPRKFR